MNTCILHSSGALLIDISSVSMLENSLALRPASTPSDKQGNHEVIIHLFPHNSNVPNYKLTSCYLSTILSTEGQVNDLAPLAETTLIILFLNIPIIYSITPVYPVVIQKNLITFPSCISLFLGHNFHLTLPILAYPYLYFLHRPHLLI